MIIKAYTDGACSGNPGVGGYAGIINIDGKETIVQGCSVKVTTNNKMELKAIIEVVNKLNELKKWNCSIIIHTDSQYVIDCTSHKTKAWFKDRPNDDLWFQLITAGNKGHHKIKFIKVKAHSGDKMNERCDKIAKEECARAKHMLLKR